ncbi:hypothetical protein D3C80_704210 [compost metagenome]
MVGNVAGIAGLLHRRRKGAHFEIGLSLEWRDFPGTCRIDGGAAQREEILAVRIGLGFETVAEIGLPLGERLVGLDPVSIGQLLGAGDQRLAAFLALPVVRTDIVIAHGGGFPLVLGAHRQRDVVAIRLDLVEQCEELVLGLRHFGLQLLERLLVVDEAVDDRCHRHAEGRLAVIGGPCGLGRVGKILDAVEIVERRELALLEHGQRQVERAAGDEITCSACFQLGVDGGIVFGRRHRCEGHLDAGVLRFEGRDQLFLPDRQVVVAPAFDGQRCILRQNRACRSKHGRGEKHAFQ